MASSLHWHLINKWNVWLEIFSGLIGMCFSFSAHACSLGCWSQLWMLNVILRELGALYTIQSWECYIHHFTMKVHSKLLWEFSAFLMSKKFISLRGKFNHNSSHSYMFRLFALPSCPVGDWTGVLGPAIPTHYPLTGGDPTVSTDSKSATVGDVERLKNPYV